MFSPFLRPFSGWKSVSGESWHFRDHNGVFQIFNRWIFRLVEVFKNWCALIRESMPRDDEEKALPRSHLQLGAC